jgi:hypothetical protein
MAGGNWTSQNKIIPGVYINTRSRGDVTASIGEKGVVAICEPLSFGPTGVISEYIPGTDPTPIIGSDLTSADALFLREMTKGSALTKGPKKVLIYRPTGTSGVEATATVGALTATAKYVGTRGNDITIIIAANAVTGYDIVTSVGGAIVDTQTVSDLKDLVANDWVTFSGTGTTITTTAGTALTGGVNPTVSTSDYSAFLTALEPYTFDIVCYDGSDATVRTAMKAFVVRVSNEIGKKCQVVMSGATAMDSEWVINVNNGVKLADGTTLTAGQATWWVAGAEAGALYNQSLTFAIYPEAVEANPKKTNAQVETAIQAGDIVFIDDFGDVKLCTDINTLTTFSVEKGSEFSKNRVMRTLNQICNDVYEYFSKYFIGKLDNNDTGRNLMKAWVVKYLNEMQANNGIQNFDAEDVSVTQGNTLDSVLVDIAIQPVDSVEKVYATITVRVTAE